MLKTCEVVPQWRHDLSAKIFRAHWAPEFQAYSWRLQAWCTNGRWNLPMLSLDSCERNCFLYCIPWTFMFTLYTAYWQMRNLIFIFWTWDATCSTCHPLPPRTCQCPIFRRRSFTFQLERIQNPQKHRTDFLNLVFCPKGPKLKQKNIKRRGKNNQGSYK